MKLQAKYYGSACLTGSKRHTKAQIGVYDAHRWRALGDSGKLLETKGKAHASSVLKTVIKSNED